MNYRLRDIEPPLSKPYLFKKNMEFFSKICTRGLYFKVTEVFRNTDKPFQVLIEEDVIAAKGIRKSTNYYMSDHEKCVEGREVFDGAAYYVDETTELNILFTLKKPPQDVEGNRAIKFSCTKASITKVSSYLDKLISNRRKLGEHNL